MSQRIAKVHQQAVTDVLGQIPLKATDDSGTGCPIRSDDLAQLFGVESCGEGGGTYYVTEHHSKLAAFARTESGVRRPRSGVFFLFTFYPFRLFALFRLTRPYQDSP